MRKEKTFFQEERGEGEEGSEGKGKESGTAIRQWALTTTEGFVGRYEDKLKINMARKSGMLRRLSLRGPERIELSQSATLNLTSPTFFPNKTASLCRPATEPTPIFKTTALSFSAQPVRSQQTISEYVYRRLTVKRNFEEGKQAQYNLLPGCVKHGGEKGKEMAKMNYSIKSKLFSDYQTAPHLDAMQF